MRAIIQRVNFGQVTVEGRLIADIKLGLVILLGVGDEDTQIKASQLAK